MRNTHSGGTAQAGGRETTVVMMNIASRRCRRQVGCSLPFVQGTDGLGGVSLLLPLSGVQTTLTAAEKRKFEIQNTREVKAGVA